MADFLLLLFYFKILRMIFKFAVFFFLEIFILSKATFLLYKKNYRKSSDGSNEICL